MNKYLLALVGALTMLISFSSCMDQEEIDITYHHDVVVEINPVDFYQNSGIDVSEFQTMLGSGYLSCVHILVYNSDGTFKSGVMATSTAFHPLSIPLKDLDEKEYTIVALQYLMERDAAENKEDRFWNVLDSKDISNVRIQSKYYQIPWYYCLGIETKIINIKSDKSFHVSPKIAGSFVSLEYKNLDSAGYNRVGLYFKDVVVGLYLDPSREGHSKYYYGNYNASNDWTSIAELTNPDRPEILYKYDEDTFFFFETGKINCFIGLSTKDGEREDGSVVGIIPYPSLDNYLDVELGQYYKAFCSYNGDDNKITTYIGLKSGFEKWYENYVNWIPSSFSQPYTKWGASVAEVKSEMANKNYVVCYDLKPVDFDESTKYYYLGYYGKLAEDNIQYVFENKSGNLIASLEYIWEMDLSLQEILQQFENDPQYEKDEEYFEEYYEEYGYYYFRNSRTDVYIVPNNVDDYGLVYTYIQYEPNIDESTVTQGSKRISPRKCLKNHFHQPSITFNKAR